MFRHFTPRLVVMLAVVVARVAFAQISSGAKVGIHVNQYHPAEIANDGFAYSRPDDLGHVRFAAQIQFDYAMNPLVIERVLNNSNNVQSRIIAHQLSAHLHVALGLFDRLIVFVGMPFSLMQMGQKDPNFPSNDGNFSLGDPSLGLRLRFFGDKNAVFSMGARVDVSMPLADLARNEQRFSGLRSVGINPALLGEFRFGRRVRLGLNLGFRIRPEGPSVLENLRVGSEYFGNINFTVAVIPDAWELMLEGFGATGFYDFANPSKSPFFKRETSPAEILLGTKFFFAKGFMFGLAGGPGMTHGYGTPLFRGILTFGYAPRIEAFRDSDGDGIDDSADKCPTAPEDRDGFEDADGCPDFDNDQDGIFDPQDMCPLEKGVAEYHGCPLKDTDRDGVDDNHDQCIQEPGPKERQGCPIRDADKDGVEDANDACPNELGTVERKGCPLKDEDGDGIEDALDNCPKEKGTRDNAGCPAAQKQLVVITRDRIIIKDKVYFATGKAKVLAKSFPMLRNIAQVLIDHPEVKKVEVEGHTDNVGNHDKNVKLSQDRADSVRAFLIGEGVEPDRLHGVGHGPDKPIDSNQTAAGKANNRRVEFNFAPMETKQEVEVK